MAKKGQTFKKYSPEFKLSVILDMREHKLSYHETMRKYFPHLADSKNFSFLLKWERKYLEEGIEGLAKENRGRPTVNGKKRGRPLKLDTLPTKLINLSCGTLSKNFSRSISTIHR